MSKTKWSVVAGDFNNLVSGVNGKLLCFQEVAYQSRRDSFFWPNNQVGLPSGYPVPTNGGSEEEQRQFVENVFIALENHPSIVFMGYFILNDFSPASAYNYSLYYGVGGNPLFEEYLASLGLRRYANATAKVFMLQVRVYILTLTFFFFGCS